MNCLRSGIASRAAGSLLAGLALLVSTGVSAEGGDFDALIAGFPHAVEVDKRQESVRDHEVGLGALQKSRGSWQFKASERLSGELSRATYQVIDGFSAFEVLEQLQRWLAEQADTTLLFSCDGRACGHASQWANRVFGQRVLYGREDQQHYRVYSTAGDPGGRVLLYSGTRTAERQYLHVEQFSIVEN